MSKIHSYEYDYKTLKEFMESGETNISFLQALQVVLYLADSNVDEYSHVRKCLPVWEKSLEVIAEYLATQQM